MNHLLRKLDEIPFGVLYYGTAFLIAAAVMFGIYEEATTINHWVMFLFTSAVFGVVFAPTVMMLVMFAVVFVVAILNYPRWREASERHRAERAVNYPARRATRIEPETDEPGLPRFDLNVCPYGQADCAVYDGGICTCGFPGS